MPAGSLVTVPEPVPVFSTVRVYWDIAIPFPLNGISSAGVSGSLEFIVNIAVFVPADVGVNVNERLQLSLGVDVNGGFGHVPPTIANIPASVPVSVAFDTCRSAVPVLVNVTVCAVDVVFTFISPKVREVGEDETLGTGVTKPIVSLYAPDQLPTASLNLT